MGGTEFYKLSGSGNDFIMIDGRMSDPSVWSKEAIAAVCARRTGAGADGMIFILPGSGQGAVRFVFYNSDGSLAPMCGNGALCATRLAGELDMAPRRGMVLETDAGTYRTCWANEDGSRASIWLEDAVPDDIPAPVPLLSGEKSLHLLRVGVPHVVVVVDDVEEIDLKTRGSALRHHEAFAPGGANINFVSGLPEGIWKMRTYERGVEDETLACGTGAVASTAVLVSTGQGEPPFSFLTRSGCTLEIHGEVSEGGAGLTAPVLTGNTEIVYLGVLGII